MRVTWGKEFNLLHAGEEVLSEREVEKIKAAELAIVEFDFSAEYDNDGCLEGFVRLDVDQYKILLSRIALVLDPLALSSFNMLLFELAKTLSEYQEGQALDDAATAYWKAIEAYQDEAMCDRRYAEQYN
jgi:hypothetical protein